jgi:hypothetical protein
VADAAARLVSRQDFFSRGDEPGVLGEMVGQRRSILRIENTGLAGKVFPSNNNVDRILPKFVIKRP